MTVTASERSVLLDLATAKHCVVEVGVFEGATSAGFAGKIADSGCVWLVDPFVPGTRPERLFGFSFTQFIAKKSVKQWQDRVRFVRLCSTEAVQEMPHGTQADLVFIDADHSYDSVREDFLTWSARLGPDGALAFHDSRLCSARPDLLPTTGPVRLMREILEGAFGRWTLVASADSVAAIRRASNTR